MAVWQFRPLNPNDNSGVSTVEDNFANEERTSVEILVRETLQNPLDARNDNSQSVEVRYRIISVPKSASILAQIFPEEAIRHFVAGKLLPNYTLPESINFLVIEDFGTTGLQGNYTDSSVDGNSENWNAFWFREGEGAKPSRANGGAGQGKITLFAASAVRSVLALTHRISDGKELLFGCCRFRRNYKLDTSNERWAKEARWCETPEPQLQALPIENPELLQMFKTQLGLTRINEPGTSFVVPMPEDITLDSLKRAVINEFLFPIRRGRLKVIVGDDVIDEKTISSLASSLGDDARYHRDFRSFLGLAITSHIDSPPTATAAQAWITNSKLTADAFNPHELETLKEQFEKGELVSVDFPVKIKKRDAAVVTGCFKVVLRQYADGDQSHELFVRQDLGIDGEGRLRSSRRVQPVLALTFISDSNLSAFLVAAEEPTHRTWNAKRPKVTALYSGTSPLLNAVRNAALRLVEYLTPSGVRDTTALSLYFSDPQSIEGNRRGGAGSENTSSGTKQDPMPASIPTATPKPIEFRALKTGFVIRTVPAVLDVNKLPLECSIKTAYATTLGDPFKLWDAADFWLNEDKEFPILSEGASEIVRDGNELRWRFDSQLSSLEVAGFDPNRQVEVQITYRETDNAENNEDN